MLLFRQPTLTLRQLKNPISIPPKTFPAPKENDWHFLLKPDIQNENAVRWQIVQLHRELKQLTGSEKCERRKARSQRNHLACCYHAWPSLKVKAQEFGKSLYEVQRDLLSLLI